MKVAIEQLTDSVLVELSELLSDHLNEVNGEDSYNIDWDAIWRMTETGFMRLYSLREVDGKLSGYAAVIASEDILKKNSSIASVQTIYVKKSKRMSKALLFLLSEIERDLRQYGEISSLCIHSHTKGFSNFLNKKMGYNELETVYQKAM